VTARARLSALLVALLLFAQHAAVTHAVWHARGELAGHGPDAAASHAAHGPEEDSTQAQLCAFDAALVQVLGAAAGSGAQAPLADPGAERAAAPAAHYAHVATVPRKSRSPPAFS